MNLERVVGTDTRTDPAVRRPAAAPVRAKTSGRDPAIPFTGLDLALLVVGGGPLILIGLGLRRRLAPAPGAAGAAGS